MEPLSPKSGPALALSPIAWGLLTTALRRGQVSAHVRCDGLDDYDGLGKLRLLERLAGEGLVKREGERGRPQLPKDVFVDFSLTEKGRAIFRP
jgi:hypothetical protein